MRGLFFRNGLLLLGIPGVPVRGGGVAQDRTLLGGGLLGCGVVGGGLLGRALLRRALSGWALLGWALSGWALLGWALPGWELLHGVHWALGELLLHGALFDGPRLGDPDLDRGQLHQPLLPRLVLR